MTFEYLFLICLASLVYAYVLYPGFCALIGDESHPPRSSYTPRVSMLVPAHNEASVIAAKIKNFGRIDYPAESLELIVADDGSTDGTSEIVRQHVSDRIRVLAAENRGGKAAAMNRLVEAATSSIVLFTDANVMLDPRAVRRMVDNLENDGVGAVTGEVRLQGSDSEFHAGESVYYKLERKIQTAESRISSVMGVDGGMYLIRRDLYPTLAADTILDDFFVSMFVMRAGKRIVYASAAQAVEGGTPSSRQEFNRRSRIAAGALQLLKRGFVPRLTQPILWFQFISHKLLRWLSPLLLVAVLISNLAVADLNAGYQIVLVMQIAVYGAIGLTFLIPRVRTTRLGAILFYFGISQLGMAVGLVRGVLNCQSVQWEKSQRLELAETKSQDSHNAISVKQHPGNQE